MRSTVFSPLLALLLALLSVASSSAASLYPPIAGTDRGTATYFDAAEAYLQDIDLNDPELNFKRLGGTTATNWAVEAAGVPIANLKCSGGNTNHHGAIVAYRLGRELDFAIYPVAVYRDVDRLIDGRRISEQCALKEWASVFTQYYWTRETFESTDSRDKRRLIKALSCEAPQPDAEENFTYYARSSYGDPKLKGQRRVRYRGETTLLAAARDFSNMMVIDALIGNEDRFPGGNLFFRAVDMSFKQDETQILFDQARLFSLDNEAAFKGKTPTGTHAARDLRAHISRFDPSLIAGLEKLAADPQKITQISAGDEQRASFLRSGIQFVLDTVQDARQRCGAAADFTSDQGQTSAASSLLMENSS